jgi:phage shock protein E
MKIKIVVLLIFISFYVFAGGQDDTVPDTVTSASLQELISSQDYEYILIDVRTASEYAEGHILTALNIPYDVIADNLPTEDKNMYLIVYCRSGRRSGIAKSTLESLGFTNVIDFGGVTNWEGELVTE